MNRGLVFLLVLLSLLLPTQYGDASSHGMEGLSETGCSCHGEQAEGTSVSVQGIPSTYTPGDTYRLTVSISGGPDAADQGHTGGFNLKASEGLFSPVDTSTHVLTPGEITHEHSGANQRSWTVEWMAPLNDNEVVFTVAGNAVDGDHQPTDGDDWGLAVYNSTGQPLTFSERVELHLPKLIAISLFVVPTLYLFRINRAK